MTEQEGLWYHAPSKVISVTVTKPTPKSKLGIAYRQCHNNNDSTGQSKIVISKVRPDGLFRKNQSLCRLVPGQEIVAINDHILQPGTTVETVKEILDGLTDEVSLQVRTARYLTFSVGYQSTMKSTDTEIDKVVPRGATKVSTTTDGKAATTACDLPDIFRQAGVPVELYRYIVDVLLCQQVLPHADMALERQEKVMEALSRYNLTALGNDWLGDAFQWDQQKAVFDKTNSASNCTNNAAVMTSNVLAEANALLNAEYRIKVQSLPTIMKYDTDIDGVIIPTALYFSTF